MKTKITIILTAVVPVGLFIFGLRFQNLKKENRDLRQNNNWISKESQHYKTSDSLNAISIQQFNLSLKEYKESRQEDYETIMQLTADKKRLQSITTSQSQTIYKLKTEVRDSIVYRDSLRIDTIKCWNYKTIWIDFSGCIENGTIDAQITSRDSLLYVEHIIPRRFLFIKWGQKERRQDIISKNPDTEIISAEFITIRD